MSATEQSAPTALPSGPPGGPVSGTVTSAPLMFPTSTSSTMSLSTDNRSMGSTFVGNTPSAVLFFLAMAVGVAIACLFIFFTIRYFVRSRYGFHMYTVSSRGVLFSSGVSTEVNYYHYSNREIREHLQYLRNHHYIRDEFLERRLFSAEGRRRRRRGRFSKMKKLTPQEVEELFPKTTYEDWLNSASVEEAGYQLAENASSVEGKPINDTATVSDVVELQQLDIVPTHPEEEDPDHIIAYIGQEGSAVRQGQENTNDNDAVSLTNELHKMHFDSGSCAICLDTFEPSDIVRGLICGHVYHSDCLDPWLTRRRACCPICKRDYYKEDNAVGGVGVALTSNVVEGASVHDNQSTVASNLDSEHPDNATTVGDTNTVGEASTTAEANANTGGDLTTLDILNDDLNHEYLRRDSHIQALFNELIPLSERVRVILEEHPEMDLEARAREVAARKYRSMWRIFFWKLMGISKEDLYQWAVLELYQNTQRSAENVDAINLDSSGLQRTNEHRETTGNNQGSAGDTNENNNGRRSPVVLQDLADGERTSTPEEIEMVERPHVFNRPQGLATPYGNEAATSSEVDLSVARRETVERNA